MVLSDKFYICTKEIGANENDILRAKNYFDWIPSFYESFVKMYGETELVWGE